MGGRPEETGQSSGHFQKEKWEEGAGGRNRTRGGKRAEDPGTVCAPITPAALRREKAGGLGKEGEMVTDEVEKKRS